VRGGIGLTWRRDMGLLGDSYFVYLLLGPWRWRLKWRW
jgi:hypothetical protein